jgi:hypothetical protein
MIRFLPEIFKALWQVQNISYQPTLAKIENWCVLTPTTSKSVAVRNQQPRHNVITCIFAGKTTYLKKSL